MEQLVDVLIAAAAVIIPALVGVAVQALRRHMAMKDAEIQSNIGFNNYYLLEKLAKGVIEAAEQTVDLDTNEKRKAFACELLKELAERYNVPVSGTQIDGLVEAAVLALKRKELPSSG